MPPTPDPIAPPQKSAGWGASLREFVLYVAVAAAVLIPFRTYIAKPFIVNGASMSPTFESGDYLIIDEISYLLRDPRRGEVAVFRFPEDPKKNFIKRVIGLPGETVTIERGTVTVTTASGETLRPDEDYVKIPSTAGGTWTLGPDEYFALGDNRVGSYDSRSWGAVPRSYFVGRALAELLPISKMGLFPGDASDGGAEAR